MTADNPAPTELPINALQRWYPNATYQAWQLDAGNNLAVAMVDENNNATKKLFFATDIQTPLFLHWGLTDKFHLRWFLPPTELHPQNTVVFDDRAVRTPFIERENFSFLELNFTEKNTPQPMLTFVLNATQNNSWHKYQNHDLLISLFSREVASPFADESLEKLAHEIIAGEVGRSSWTLMHRYELAKNLLAHANDALKQWQIIFVWLRYSAIRQLDWQRNYNTKPRDLAWSQKMLSQKIGECWRDFPQHRQWARFLLQTVGRGGEGGQGQQIRDEILNIMHRHHLKEAHGHFIEEWHQKLHNNTTPDDVEICKAFIAFMRANGDKKVFYDTLEKNGVTRERLRNFERPIVTEPEFYAHCKDGVIADFENYLRVLQTVHGGAELEAAGARAINHLSDNAKRLFSEIKSTTNFSAGQKIIELRREILSRAPSQNNVDALLDLLYFDLALSEKFRTFYEQALNDLSAMFNAALLSCELIAPNDELKFCQQHFSRLANKQNTQEKALELLAILERCGRVVQNETNEIALALQTPADYLGENFNAALWTRKIFVEEVIRGSDWFALAKIIDALLKITRQQAGIGGWQLISPATIRGRVKIVANLHSVMNEIYQEPTILLTDHAGGDEDAPAGCVGIMTRTAPDLVAHLSVRARNLGILFAACYDDEAWEKLTALNEKFIEARTTANSVEYNETENVGAENKNIANISGAKIIAPQPRPPFSRWILTANEFTRILLGGKSNNLNLLRGKIPAWMNLPTSLALPFGICEEILENNINRAVREKLNAILAKAENDPFNILPPAREMMMQLQPVGEFQTAFIEATQNEFPQLTWDLAWTAIKKVWASKWNERAFLSRRQNGLPHENLLMAVLLQQVVDAQYAFVIHTANPLTGNTNEVFTEMVLGLGETLVGNYPGHALGFISEKNSGKIIYTSFPSKSAGIYGRGIIFRSDSNGEDLSGFAGAGLYDSILAEAPQTRLLNYTDEKLLTDENFRVDVVKKITAIAIEVEKICGSAQDIEGAIQPDGKFYIVQNRPQVGL